MRAIRLILALPAHRVIDSLPRRFLLCRTGGDKQSEEEQNEQTGPFHFLLLIQRFLKKSYRSSNKIVPRSIRSKSSLCFVQIAFTIKAMPAVSGRPNFDSFKSMS